MAVFRFQFSHEIGEEVVVTLGKLTGSLPELLDVSTGADEGQPAADVFVECFLAYEGHVIDGPLRTPLSPADIHGAGWKTETSPERLRFVIKVSDLSPGCVLACELWAHSDASGRYRVGSAVLPFFNKHGRLKSGLQCLKLHSSMPADAKWPSSTPGKQPGARSAEIRRLEQLVKQLERGEMQKCSWLDSKTLRAISDLEAHGGVPAGLHLTLQLPLFPCAVLYSQPGAQTSALRFSTSGNFVAGRFAAVPDPEVERAAAGGSTNPCEEKALKLSQASGALGFDRDAKPNKDELALLRSILATPPSRPLGVHHKTLLSKFRLFLATQPNTIVPFLRSVNWDSPQEVKIALDAIRDWQAVSVEEALQMLSSPAFHPAVRALAVHVLEDKADDAQILTFLNQLVQCVRFDEAGHQSSLADFLVQRCSKSPHLAVALHWGLLVNSEAGPLRERAQYMQKELYSSLRHWSQEAHTAVEGQFRFKTFLDNISKALASAPNNQRAKEDALRIALTHADSDSQMLVADVPFPLDPSQILRCVVCEQCKVFKSVRSPVKFVFRLQSAGNGEDATGLAQGQQLLRVLYKEGDDLRQDQFVCQLIGIMDKLLKRENLDLRLTPYWVLPITKASGILEFVPSVTLQDLTAKGKSEGVLRFLAEHNPAPGASGTEVPLHRLREGIAPAAMENFIRSNAGYAIVSYLLDMGDRHQENILLSNDGKLFHIDFGYVLGMRDPKQWAKVPVPLKRELIAAMGGQSSEDYKTFRKLAVEAYIILRKHSSLFLTLLGCMAGSPIACFSGDAAGISLDFALTQMEERFKVDVSDDVARTHIFTLIDQSIANMLAPMGDTAHRIAANFRQ